MAEGGGGQGRRVWQALNFFMECKVWVFGKGCSVAPGRGRGGDEDGRARAGYPRDFGVAIVDGGTRASSPTAPGPNGTGLAGQCYPCPRIMANGGWRREVSEFNSRGFAPVPLSTSSARPLPLVTRTTRGHRSASLMTLGMGVGVVGGRTDRGHVSSVAVREERGR